MLKKILLLILICLNCFTCMPKYEVVRLPEKYSFYIDNWKQGGIKIIHIDTIRTFHGKVYKVKYKD